MKDDNKTKKLVPELAELCSQNAVLKKSIPEGISAELASEEYRRYAESIVETIREPLLVMNMDLKKYFYAVSFLIIILWTITSAYGVTQSRWVSLPSDRPSSVKGIVESEVDRQEGYSTPEQAALNLSTAQKEKDEEDAAYKSEIRSATNDFNRSKKRRDELMAQFQATSQEKEELQKSIQNLKKTIENCESSIARFEQDIQSQQHSLETWLKTEKQGEVVMAVIYTRGFKDVAQHLEGLADQASAPLLAEHMGVKIQAYSRVINNVLTKDFVKATVEGTAKPFNEETLKLELNTSPAGTIYLRLKRYELFPFQSPVSGHVKPGKDAEKFKEQVITSESDLEEFLRKNGYPRSKAELVRFRQMIEEAKENNRAGDDSLNNQISTYQSRINQYKEKIDEQRSEKGRNEGKLSRDQGNYKKQEGEVALIEASKNNAEREFQQAQTSLQQKKRTRETIIIKDARAIVKGSESPANAVALAINDKLKEVKNDARTQHSTATTTVVNYQVASEHADQAVTDASILSIRLVSFLNEGDSGVRVQMAFRVRTMLADENKELSEAPVVEKRENTKVIANGNPSSLSTANELRRDGRFIAYDNSTVLDTQTNLMWAARDNGANINWWNAKSYCDNYRGGGYADWRMPTSDELAGLYDSSNVYSYELHLTKLIQLSASCPWASETRGSDAALFSFGNGKGGWTRRSNGGSRALPVRLDKAKALVEKNEQQKITKPDQAEEPITKKVKKAKRSKKTATIAMERASVSTVNETRRDGRFIAYDNGTVLDTSTKLIWAAKDNNGNINWTDAKSYCENYRGGGYTDWRMPTQDELAGLYEISVNGRNGYHLTTLITLTACCPWTSETRKQLAGFFGFDDGEPEWIPGSFYNSKRALPVRSGKSKKTTEPAPVATGESSNVSSNHMHNLRNSCTSGNTRFACVWIAETTSSTCKKMNQCADAMASTLRANGITFITTNRNYPDTVTAYKPGCIGYRSDIGGTKAGAMDLVKLLGENQYYVDGSSCRLAGFKYNIIRR